MDAAPRPPATGKRKQSSLLAFFPAASTAPSPSAAAPKKSKTTREPALRFVREHGWKKVKQETSSEVDGCVVYEDGEGGRLRYWPAFLPNDEATRLYDHLRTSTAWSQGHGRTATSSPTASATASPTTAESPGPSYVNAQGARVSTPRMQKHYGRGIAGGSKFRCGYREWPADVWALKARVETAADRSFNFVLLNFYRDQDDYMSPHTDAGQFLGSNPAIGSLSLGAARRFVLHYADRTAKPAVPRFELPLAHGSLLVMAGSTQHRWLHSVPKQRALAAGRINLTFRFVLDAFGDDDRGIASQ
ncbi:alkylated DNA repair protein [Acanthamoeba castellanii str. Neff]|uniref:Alkylated DNA repair protein n=1 Tax=Acanthamoeba castellanii (strain ATCC 30010 / Neff) TaxID=1257118 RepID=L8GVM3_ACACF|nr:alkylated DNA repair protein [Acanthamoeba castellanii str. Neff]ELR16101.1 alkylated DNA repair protein [Acanthamoeba castellanii str. Neff]